MTLTDETTKRIIRKLLQGEDYRVEIVALIDATFLDFVVDFFKRVVDAKFAHKNIDIDWYEKEFLDEKLATADIAVHAGLNLKTIGNMYNSARKEIVIDVASAHYKNLHASIRELTDSQQQLDLRLTLKLRDISVDLDINESLVVINTLAVKRAALRGGLWSTAGKQVEKPLMETLCKLHQVPAENYSAKEKPGAAKRAAFTREIDFYLVSGDAQHKCEVKLMGKGNPESADAIFARASKVFVADKLSATNKAQLDSAGVEWVQLREANGFRRFQKVLRNLSIPHAAPPAAAELDAAIEPIFGEIFPQ